MDRRRAIDFSRFGRVGVRFAPVPIAGQGRAPQGTTADAFRVLSQGFFRWAVRPPCHAAAPAAETITPALIEAAKKEGKLAFYTAMDLVFAQKFANIFQEKFPGISVRV